MEWGAVCTIELTWRDAPGLLESRKTAMLSWLFEGRFGDLARRAAMSKMGEEAYCEALATKALTVAAQEEACLVLEGKVKAPPGWSLAPVAERRRAKL